MDVSDADFAFQLQMKEAIKASLISNPSKVFSVYFKGLVCGETVSNVRISFAGIGVAICDRKGSCLHELRKACLLDAGDRGTEGDHLVELEALIEASNAAVDLGLKRLRVFCACNSVYEYLTGTKQPITSHQIAALVDQVNLIKSKFFKHVTFHSKSDYHAKFQVKRNHIKFVNELATEAIISKATEWAKGDSGVAVTEQCTICFESIHHDQMISAHIFVHRYCISCMRKHVEAKLLQGQLPKCPHENCESNISIETCKKLQILELYNIMRLRVKEASIPPEDRVYCPFSNCSASMSKSEVKQHTSTSSSTRMRTCVECNRHFCINCQVPWHDNISCLGYKMSALFLSSNEAKLKSLAEKERWRKCNKCKNLVELAAGCYHITCRCGHEFCYKCGAEYHSNMQQTCRCPRWAERDIIY